MRLRVRLSSGAEMKMAVGGDEDIIDIGQPLAFTPDGKIKAAEAGDVQVGFAMEAHEWPRWCWAILEEFDAPV